MAAHRIWRCASALAMILCVGHTARAQELTAANPKGKTAPAPRTADGHPDFSGYWKGVRGDGPVGNIGKDLPGFTLPLTPAGEAALTRNRTETIDPESLCVIGGIPRHNASGLPFEVLQGRNKIAFLYWYSYYRLIPISANLKHTDDPDPSFFGEEMGRWEGDTLVVDSVAFKDEQVWADENADPHSDALHVVERWTRPDAAHIHVETLIDDPKFYTRSFTYSRTWVLGTADEHVGEYSCSENNVDRAHLQPGPGPIRPDGTRGYIDAAPLPPPIPRTTTPGK
ncbi:MAG TPA: hypothetical protein VLV86_13675 [Vicinamibacterales bacterium]|nr:hypothetical protein [Vicinamibacterales bacterium]